MTALVLDAVLAPTSSPAGTVAFDRLTQWLLRIGAFALPLVVVWDAVDRFVLPKLLLARLLAIALLVMLLSRGILTRSWRWRATALDIPLVAVVVSTAIASVFAVNHNVALFGMYARYEGLLTILTYAAIFWLTVQLIPGRAAARDLGRSLLAGAVVVSAIALFQALTGRGLGPDTSVGQVTRAFATMGSPVELGTFLAMMTPFGLYEVLDARTALHRLIGAASVVIVALALLLTFTRAAWAAALIGVVIVFAVCRPSREVLVRAVGALALFAIIGSALVLLGGRSSGAPSVAQAVVDRAQAATALSEGSVAFRLHLWSDSLTLLSARPLVGSGPDSFALVYPTVQTGNWAADLQVDKAHNDILQLAVTSGLLGVIADYLVLMAIAVQLWRRRRDALGAALLAGLVAYEVALQAEFSWVPAALPFWLLAAAAFALPPPRPSLADGDGRATPTVLAMSPARIGVVAVIIAAGAVIAFFAVVPDMQADRLLALAVKADAAGDLVTAHEALDVARQANPYESAYAVAVGNFALNLQSGVRPGPGADLGAARNAYQTAIALGTPSASVFRNLAIVDVNLGDRGGALAAARRAVELNRYDPANIALLQNLEVASR